MALFIVNQSSLGLALTRFETRALGARLAYFYENHPPLGRKWLRAFLSRRPKLRSRKNQRVEAICLRASIKKNTGYIRLLPSKSADFLSSLSTATSTSGKFPSVQKSAEIVP